MPGLTVRYRAAFSQILGFLVVIILVVAAFATAQVTAAAQESGVPLYVYVANCERNRLPGEGPILGEQGDLPEYCEVGEGVTINVFDLDGNVLGTCTTGAGGSCRILVPAPEGTEVEIEEDESTIKPGYSPVENPFVRELRTFEGLDEAVFINLPDDDTGLPDTGSGSGAEAGPGSLTHNLAGLLAALATVLGVSGAVLRQTAVRSPH